MVTTTLKPAKTIPTQSQNKQTFNPQSIIDLVNQKIVVPKDHEIFIHHICGNDYRMNIHKIFQPEECVFKSRVIDHSELIKIIQTPNGLDLIRSKSEYDWKNNQKCYCIQNSQKFS
jgi:mRNA-degrading endonuclease HigB of HigAB toxin-antitoxin module